MQANKSWLGDQAFGEDTGELVTVTYKSHQDALLFMRSALCDEKGIGLLHGPRLSGKTTIVQRLADKLPGNVAVAVVDGTRIKPRELLSRTLAQFGYDTGLESNDELVNMISMFAIQQTRSFEPPILIVDNADRMYPSALRTLNKLADITVQDLFAIRMIVTGGEGLGAIINSNGMVSVKNRVFGRYVAKPLTLREALIYLHARLAAVGVNNADTVFPVDVCDALYQQSGGWPGLMNRFAREAIGRAADFPLRLSDTVAQDDVEDEAADDSQEIPVLGVDEAQSQVPPRLVITKDGNIVSDFALTERKVMIGRSDFADIIIEDDFISKMHAALLLYSDALVLLDLNSANGITVNSVRVRSAILKNDDIISLGNHRLKVQNAPAISEEMAELAKTPDTIKMKNLIDLRRLKAQQSTRAVAQGKNQG